MMPDLGKYAGPVLWSYGLGIAILAATLWQGARVRRALAEAEARVGKTDG